ERSFNQIQNTVITRLNKEIEDVTETATSVRHVQALEKKLKGLASDIDSLQVYLTGNNSNGIKLNTLYDDITDLKNAFSSDGDSTDATDAEVTNFGTMRDNMVKDMKNMFLISHPDINDGNIIFRLKRDIPTLEELQPVTGVVDVAGTSEADATNDNRAILDYLSDLQTEVSTAIDTTRNTETLSINMKINYVAKATHLQANLTEITVVEAQEKITEIDNLKLKYANLLKAISISFEVSQSMTDSLNQRLQPTVPDKGSVLNLFV
ncbi:MAG: hypothetical protein KAI73_01570, partial [Rhodospirillaceae bacterium]|nr:hypothetical protein [Rhodospirillaceae bacterium]